MSLEAQLNDLNKKAPEITTIFKFLQKGLYINENSSKADIAKAYRYIGDNESLIRALFKPFSYQLIKRPGYYYFVNYDSTISPNEIDTISDYIEILYFLKTVDNDFSSRNDFTFRLSSLEASLNEKIELQDIMHKMKAIKKADTNRAFIENLVKKLVNDGFIEEIDTKENKFLVLKSFDYIESFYKEIEVYE